MTCNDSYVTYGKDFNRRLLMLGTTLEWPAMKTQFVTDHYWTTKSQFLSHYWSVWKQHRPDDDYELWPQTHISTISSHKYLYDDAFSNISPSKHWQFWTWTDKTLLAFFIFDLLCGQKTIDQNKTYPGLYRKSYSHLKFHKKKVSSGHRIGVCLKALHEQLLIHCCTMLYWWSKPCRRMHSDRFHTVLRYGIQISPVNN